MSFGHINLGSNLNKISDSSKSSSAEKKRERERGNTNWQSLAKNFLALRQFYYFLKIFSKFFGIFNGEKTLISKNGLVSEKNYFIFFPLLGGEGFRPKSGIFHFFKIFFFEPFP